MLSFSSLLLQFTLTWSADRLLNYRQGCNIDQVQQLFTVYSVRFAVLLTKCVVSVKCHARAKRRIALLSEPATGD